MGFDPAREEATAMTEPGCHEGSGSLSGRWSPGMYQIGLYVAGRDRNAYIRLLFRASLTRAAPAPRAAFGHSFNRCGPPSIMGEHSAAYWYVREIFGWGAAALFIALSSRVCPGFR